MSATKGNIVTISGLTFNTTSQPQQVPVAVVAAPVAPVEEHKPIVLLQDPLQPLLQAGVDPQLLTNIINSGLTGIDLYESIGLTGAIAGNRVLEILAPLATKAATDKDAVSAGLFNTEVYARSQDRERKEMELEYEPPEVAFKFGHCPKCNSQNITRMVKQTSRGDEAMAVRATCNDCGKEWNE